MLLERPQCPGQLLLATEVPFGVTHARGRQAEVRTLRARGSEHPVGQQRGILPEDRLLQLGELGARIQSELGSEQPPRPAHGGERVRLPTLPVLRHAQHDPAPLAQRCFGDAGARHRGDLLQPHPPAAVRPGAAPRHRAASPPGDRTRSEPVPSRGARRRAPPATARAPPRTCARRVRAPRARSCCVPRVTSRSNRSASTSTCSGTSRYPCGGGFDPRRRDEPAQPHDAPRNDLRPRGGRVVAPQRRREGFDGQGCTQADRERSHHRTIARSQRNPAVVERQRSQNAHLHGATVTPTPTSVKTADIGPIPNRRAPLSC